MKTLITYATKHGAVKKCAQKLSAKLAGDFDLVNLKKQKNINLDGYDQIIIGSSVYMGKARKEARKFCEDNIDKLSEKELAFYLCCMREGEDAERQLKDNFPKKLLDNAVTGFLGGEFNFEKMNFLEKLAVKKITGVEKSESNISEENIDEFAEKINM